MKNKLMLLCTFFIGVQAVLPIAASVESMYKDLMTKITSNSGEDYHNQLAETRNALYTTMEFKRKAESELLKTYEHNQIDTFCSIAFITLAAGISAKGMVLYCMPKGDIFDLFVTGVILPATLLVASRLKIIYRYPLRKQIKEYTEVIEKLILKCSELECKALTAKLESRK